MRPLFRVACCSFVAVLAMLTGCSAEGEDSLAEKYPTQSATCDALFGTKNMESLIDILGSDGLRFTNRPIAVDALREGLTEEAKEPYNEIEGFEEYDVCWLSGDSQFHANVAWAADSLKFVQSPSGPWQPVAEDVYLADDSYVGGDLDIVFRCEIKGASRGQQAQVLLEARVGDISSPKFSEQFHEQLAVRLARTVRDELRCANEPEIPADLKIRG
ncbi:hypothetical protein [Streptomyces sp. MN13]